MAAPLSLELVASDGVRHRSFQAEESGIRIVTPEGLKPVAADSRWEITGEVRETLSQIGWSPSCALYRRPVKLGAALPEFDALVMLEEAAPGLWPVKELKDGIAVFVWMSRGRLAHVNPVPLRQVHLGKGQVVASARFRLSAEEADGGPVVLLLREGHWVRPPQTWSQSWQQAMADLRLMTTVPTAGFSSAALAALGDDEVSKFFEMIVASGPAEWIDPLWLRLKPGAAARQVFSLCYAAVDRGRDSALVALLLRGGEKLAERQIAELIGRAIGNRFDDCAAVLVEWSRNTKRKISGLDALAALALVEGLVRTTQALAGDSLGQVATGPGTETFPMIAQRGHTAMVRLLVDSGVNPARADPDCAALILAVQTGDVELAARLLAAGAKPDPVSDSQASPLFHAVRAGQRPMVTLLLNAQANPRRSQSDGASLFHAAVVSNDDGMVAWLLEQSVRPVAAKRTAGALEMALRLQRRSAVEALLKAGERLALVDDKVHPLLRAAIALDQPAVLAQALERGWSPELPIEDDWTAVVLADAYEASRCLAWLRKQAVPAVVVDFSGGNRAPVPVALTLDPYVRSPARDHSSATISLHGVVDAQGRFRAVRVGGTDDPGLAHALRQAAANFTFEPARRGNQPVGTRIALPLILPAQPRRNYSLSDVDLPPVPLKERGMDGRNYVPPVLLGTRWASISAPLMPGVGAVQGDSIWEGLTSSGFDLRSNSPFDASGSRLPRVRFVVAPDGTTRDAEVLWAADRFDHEGALKNVAAMRYAPGIVKGRAVSVPMVLDVSPQP